VIREAVAGNPQLFITLTLPAECAEDPARWAAELVDAWRKFVRFYKKKAGYKSIPYFAVFEATKAGTPHLHILCRVPWITHGTLSWFMEREVGAPNVWVERVRHKNKAANYLGKYMGKEPGKFGFLKRYWQTRDYGDPQPRERRTRTAGFVWWRRGEYSLFNQYLMTVSIKGWTAQVRDGDHYFLKPGFEP